jgi:multiple sugar transport system substrate-binding protein
MPDIVFSFGPEDTGTVQSLVDEFNRQNTSGINVTYREMPADTGEYLQELQQMFARGGSDIDVIGGDVIWPAQFASNRWIVDLSNRFPPAEFLDATIEANTYEGKVWGVPWFTDVGMLYYRNDLLEQSGFPGPPQTWDELKQVAQKVKEDTGIQHGYVFQGAQYEGGVCNGLEFIWTHGGDVLDSNGRLIINSNEAKQGLRTERRIVEDGVAPQDVHTYTEEESTERFLDGLSIFCRNWAFMYGFLGEPDVPLSRDQVGVAPLPHDQGIQQGRGCIGGWNMFINAASAHQNEAWQFIEFMTARAQQRRLAIDASWLPSREELYLDQQLLNQAPILGLSREALNSARSRPIHPLYLEMSEEMAEQFNLSLKGDIPPARAIETLRRALSNIVGRRVAPP